MPQLQTWWPHMLDIIKADDWCTGRKLPDGRIKYHTGCNERMARRLQQPLDPKEVNTFSRIRCDAFRPDGNSLYQHLANLCSWDPEVVATAQKRVWCQACRSKVALNYLPRFFPVGAQPRATAAEGGRKRSDRNRDHGFKVPAPTPVTKQYIRSLFCGITLRDAPARKAHVHSHA
jgi:hypothetical protein